MFDPVVHPRLIRPQYNPIENPEQYVVSTLHALTLWILLAPWVDAGIVKFVRSPGDLDYRAATVEGLELPRQRLRRYPELGELLERQTSEFMDDLEGGRFIEFLTLSIADGQFAEAALQIRPDASDDEIASLLRRREAMREEHPFYVDPPTDDHGHRHPQMMMFSAGTSYDLAKGMAERSGSHLVTDVPTRWKEIEIDRAESHVEDGPWTPFAKAFSETELKYLDAVDLRAALDLRQQGRLFDMRSFLGGVWKMCSSGEPFAQSKSEDLAIELNEKVREAEGEWEKINGILASRLTKTATTGAAAVAGAIATGYGAFVPAVLSGAAGLAVVGVDRIDRRSFKKLFPAGFFLGKN